MARSGRKGGGQIGSKVAIPEDRAFATQAEINRRDSEARQESATSFQQIGPADNPGMDLAEADKSAQDRSGKFKFSRGI